MRFINDVNPFSSTTIQGLSSILKSKRPFRLPNRQLPPSIGELVYSLNNTELLYVIKQHHEGIGYVLFSELPPF